jgi:hypothetical protein
MDDLDHYAAICRVQRVMQPHLEAAGRMTGAHFRLVWQSKRPK